MAWATGVDTQGYGYDGYGNPVSGVPQQNAPAQHVPAQHNAPVAHRQADRDSKEKKSRAEYGRQYSLFSGSASVKFYEAEDKDGNPTIIIHAANKVNGNFNWADRTVLQFMQKELPELLAVLYGMVPEVKFDNHNGGGTVKSVSIRLQPNNRNAPFFISVTEKGKNARACAFDDRDAMMLASMVLTQMKKTMGVDEQTVLSMTNHFIVKRRYGP